MSRAARKKNVSGKISFFAGDDLIQRIDAYAKTLQERMPSMSVTRTDAMRTLLQLALKSEQSSTA